MQAPRTAAGLLRCSLLSAGCEVLKALELHQLQDHGLRRLGFPSPAPSAASLGRLGLRAQDLFGSQSLRGFS